MTIYIHGGLLIMVYDQKLNLTKIAGEQKVICKKKMIINENSSWWHDEKWFLITINDHWHEWLFTSDKKERTRYQNWPLTLDQKMILPKTMHSKNDGL